MENLLIPNFTKLLSPNERLKFYQSQTAGLTGRILKFEKPSAIRKRKSKYDFYISDWNQDGDNDVIITSGNKVITRIDLAVFGCYVSSKELFLSYNSIKSFEKYKQILIRIGVKVDEAERSAQNFTSELQPVQLIGIRQIKKLVKTSKISDLAFEELAKYIPSISKQA